MGACWSWSDLGTILCVYVPRYSFILYPGKGWQSIFFDQELVYGSTYFCILPLSACHPGISPRQQTSLKRTNEDGN